MKIIIVLIVLAIIVTIIALVKTNKEKNNNYIEKKVNNQENFNNYSEGNINNPAAEAFVAAKTAEYNKKEIEDEENKEFLNPTSEVFRNTQTITTELNPEIKINHEENKELLTMEELMKKNDKNQTN